MTTKDVYDDMVDKWPSAVVTRAQIYSFTGGLMKGSYVANLDSQGGVGPPRQRSGQKWIYPTRQFADWLRDRSVAKQ